MNDCLEKPKAPIFFRLVYFTLTILVLIILIASFKQTEINFFNLISKHKNATNYLFGKKLNAEDRNDAMRQAKLYPTIMTKEESRLKIRRKYKNYKNPPSFEQQQIEIDQLAYKLLNEKEQSEWQKWILEEYNDILQDKKGGYFPPETDLKKIKEYFLALLETISIAIWGSILAFITALPIAFLAASNTLSIIAPGEGATHRFIRFFSQFFIRRFLDICRGFNEFVMALIFVAVIGLGPFAGVLALWIHTFGILGKVFSEAIEASDKDPIEGVMACGASIPHILVFGILPQNMPIFLSYGLLRFETNVRSATILGFCGAGGIGFLMFDKINGYLYREVATMMIIIIFTIGLLDYLTDIIRKRFI